jgi:hypothetical protein
MQMMRGVRERACWEEGGVRAVAGRQPEGEDAYEHYLHLLLLIAVQG